MKCDACLPFMVKKNKIGQLMVDGRKWQNWTKIKWGRGEYIKVGLTFY